MKLLASALTLFFWVAACTSTGPAESTSTTGGSGQGGTSSGGGLTCTPGAVEACSCADGTPGERTCLQGGSAQSACRCASVCASTQVSLAGAVRTSVSDLSFSTATVVSEHKLDVDAQEDGCVADVTLTLRASLSGCTLALAFGPVVDGVGGLRSITLTADSFCPGFPDAAEGTYAARAGYGPWWSGPANVGQRQAQTACMPDARYTFPDRALELFRSDGTLLTVNLKDLVVSGSVVSTGDTALACVTAACAPSHQLLPSGWCAERRWGAVPSGTPRDLRAVWGAAEDNVWAGGEEGTMLHWNGSAWSAEDTGQTGTTLGLWGSSANDVWAVGTSGILRRTGGTWSRVAGVPGLFLGLALWGSSASNVWAVGTQGSILRWDGNAWTAVPSNTTVDLAAVWGSGASDVWAAGEGGNLLHWDGATWSTASSPTGRVLTGLWGNGPSNVWAVGQYNTTLRFDGVRWAAVPATSETPFFTSVWGSGAPAWATTVNEGLFRWTGTRWSQVETGEDQTWFHALWGAGPDDVWAVGEAGKILRWQL